MTYPSTITNYPDRVDKNASGWYISGEYFNIPSSTPYQMYLDHVPEEAATTRIYASGGAEWTEDLTGSPAAGEFYVEYDVGRLTFNVANAAAAMEARYDTLGDDIMAEHINNMQYEVYAIEGELGWDITGAYSTLTQRLNNFMTITDTVTASQVTCVTPPGASFTTVQGHIDADGGANVTDENPHGLGWNDIYDTDGDMVRAQSNITTGYLFAENISASGNIIALNVDGGNADQWIYFYHDSAAGEWLKWDDGDSRFEFSNELFVIGDITASGNFMPEASGTRDIGSVTDAFNDAYFDRVHLEADPTTPFMAATKQYVDDAVSGENLWDRVSTTLSTHNAGDNVDIDGQLSVAEIDWTAGNVIYVPLSGDIDTYVQAMVDGDTLVLAAGTYTIASQITTPVGGCIRGQGAGVTTVTNDTSGHTFYLSGITGSEKLILANMTITNGAAGGYAVRGYSGSTGNWDGYNLEAIVTGTGTKYGLTHEEQSGSLFNCISTATSSDDMAKAYMATTYDSAHADVYYHECWGKATGAGGGRGLEVNVGVVPGIYFITAYAYNSYFEGAGAGGTRSGIYADDSGCIVYIYNSTMKGVSQDVNNVAGAITLYDCTLVNGTTSGTITYDGTVVTEDFYASNDISLGGDLLPLASGVSDIGTVTLAMNEAYIDKVYLEADPTTPFMAATKQYVDDAITGENLWDRSGTTLTTYFSADTVQMDGYVDWAGGNTWYLPIGADINAFIASASCVDGDTIQLASGTYTITDNIDIAKAINVVGQGIGKTIVTCATVNKNIFDLAASNIRISDLSITYTTDTGASGIAINTSANLTGLVFENIDIASTGTTSNASGSVTLFGSNATFNNFRLAATNSGGRCFGVFLKNDNTVTQNAVVNVYNSSCATSAAGNEGYAWLLSNNNDANTITLNLYNSTGIASGASGTEIGMGVASTTTSNSIMNAYNCIFSGTDTDVVQTNSNTLTLYDTTLVNGTTSGTITYAGENSTAVGGNIRYLSIGDNIETAIAAATAGDTLVLASGTYTITSGITINKLLHIKGQGEGITTIATSTGNFDMITFTTTDGSTISDMTISIAGLTDSSENSMIVGGVDINVYNIEFLNTATGTLVPTTAIRSSAAKTINIENCTSSATGVARYHPFVHGLTSGATINVRNCYHAGSGGDHASSGNCAILTSTGTGATINLYNSTFIDTSDKTGGVLLANAANSFINAYNCTINGSGATAFDVKQTFGTITLYDTTLVNNTTSGTITYGGTVATAGLQGGTELVVNDASADSDFRVESDTLDDALFVQGSDGFVGVGTKLPLNKLSIETPPVTGENYMLALHNKAQANGDEQGIAFIEHTDASVSTTAGIAGIGITGAFRGDLSLRTNQGTQNTLVEVLRLDNTGKAIFTSSSTTTSALLIDANGATGATGESAVRIDSENTDTAALYITSAVDGTGASWFDQYALAVEVEGVGGGAAQFYRTTTTGAASLVKIYDQDVDTEGASLEVLCNGDATAANPVVKMTTTNAAHDQPVLQVTQAGTGPIINTAGASGSGLKLYTLTEAVTIPVGSGLDPVVVTSGNLAPAGSVIVGCAFRVTDAPGGGATTLDIGITGGDLDLLIDGASCDVLGETGDSHTNGATEWTGIIRNIAATTLTLTTDADVTVDDMIVRVVVWYYQITAPTA